MRVYAFPGQEPRASLLLRLEERPDQERHDTDKRRQQHRPLEARPPRREHEAPFLRENRVDTILSRPTDHVEVAIAEIRKAGTVDLRS